METQPLDLDALEAEFCTGSSIIEKSDWEEHVLSTICDLISELRVMRLVFDEPVTPEEIAHVQELIAAHPEWNL